MSFTTEKLSIALQKDIGRTKRFTDASTPKHAAAYLLQQNLLKKFVDSESEAGAEQAAINLFMDVNAQSAHYKTYVSDGSDHGNLIAGIISRARGLMSQQFHDRDGFPKFSLMHAFNDGGVGPGASIDASGYDIWAKLFKSRLSCTNRILHTYYRAAATESLRWEVAELIRQRHFKKVHVVKGSKLFTVPKNRTIARVCFTEPTLNMFGQLGYGNQIKKLLVKYHDISIDKQEPINSWFARAGSLNQGWGTIDLKSASDTIALSFCAGILPPRMYKDLCTLRSKYAKVPGFKYPVTLHMMSTMGNGFTFPLQTWIFATLVLATYLETKTPVHDVYGKRRYGVYGDDIVCDAAMFDTISDVLAACGFTVNKDKSFNTGAFRESCGTDYFKGVDVRAVYFKECKSDAHVYGLINRLLMWSGRHNISLRHTILYLKGLVQHRPIPLYEDIMAGIYTPIKFLTGRKAGPDGHWQYKCLQAHHRTVEVEESSGDLYFHGAVISAIYGSIRANSYKPRENEAPSYYVVDRVCPISWNHVDDFRKKGIYRTDALTTSGELTASYYRNIDSTGGGFAG